jgi:hypothetical protein
LTQLLLPAMKQRKKGRFVFVTSARYLQPEPGFSLATSIRAGTTAFALALAKEVASYGIQVNVLAPNYLYSEAYYPRARFIDDPEGRKQIRAKVPMGRLGDPEEVGELAAFLVSGRSTFMTGQVINFTGGWPWYLSESWQIQRQGIHVPAVFLYQSSTEILQRFAKSKNNDSGITGETWHGRTWQEILPGKKNPEPKAG